MPVSRCCGDFHVPVICARPTIDRAVRRGEAGTSGRQQTTRGRTQTSDLQTAGGQIGIVGPSGLCAQLFGATPGECVLMNRFQRIISRAQGRSLKNGWAGIKSTPRMCWQ